MSLIPCGWWLLYVLRHVGLHPLDDVGCLLQLLFMDMGSAPSWRLLCWWNPCSWFLFHLGCGIAFCESLADLCFPALGISRIPVLPSVGFQTYSSCSTTLLMHLEFCPFDFILTINYENLSSALLLIAPMCCKDKWGIKTWLIQVFPADLLVFVK